MNFIKKIVFAASVLFGILILVFVLFQFFGDPANMISGQSGDKKTLENIRKELYLDQPKWKQVIYYINDVSPISIHSESDILKKNLKGLFIGDNLKLAIKLPYLGKSYQSKKEVRHIIGEAMKGTIVLAFTAMLFAFIIGISLGITAAINKGTWIDNTAILSGIAGISAPSFFMAILVAYFFGFLLHDYTGLHLTGSLYEIDEVTGEKYLAIKNLILPAFTLGIRPLAIISQLTRSSMLDVMGQDYIRTAYAKGLTVRVIIFKHALRNALNPVLTAVTGWFAELLAGAFFIEYIFGWKGIGKTTVDALEKLDYPVVIGAVLCSALFFVVINLITDIIYRIIDPRIS